MARIVACFSASFPRRISRDRAGPAALRELVRLPAPAFFQLRRWIGHDTQSRFRNHGHLGQVVFPHLGRSISRLKSNCCRLTISVCQRFFQLLLRGDYRLRCLFAFAPLPGNNAAASSRSLQFQHDHVGVTRNLSISAIADRVFAFAASAVRASASCCSSACWSSSPIAACSIFRIGARASRLHRGAGHFLRELDVPPRVQPAALTSVTCPKTLARSCSNTAWFCESSAAHQYAHALQPRPQPPALFL